MGILAKGVIILPIINSKNKITLRTKTHQQLISEAPIVPSAVLGAML